MEPLRILHLSDLHFGRIYSPALDGLRNYLGENHHSIHLIIITGDLTQRARNREFVLAREFLETLTVPVFIIPGNHDVPLFHLVQRFFNPYQRFNKFLSPWSSSCYEDDKVIVCGLWTTNNFTVKKELIHLHEIDELERRILKAPDKLRIIASHHPLTPDHLTEKFRRMLGLSPHLFLWGHEHQSKVTTFSDFPGTIAVAGGTSVSSRLRTEQNSFNEITFTGKEVSVRTLHFSEPIFIPSPQETKLFLT
jgi:predicted MPP superfamily phosphohydrolase